VGLSPSLQAALRAHSTHRHSLVSNAPRSRRKNPLRLDPTRTTALRVQFIKEVKQRFTRLKKSVRDFMLHKDALGLVTHASPGHQQYRFQTDDKKLTAFNTWFKQQVEEDVIRPISASGSLWAAPSGSMATGPWTNKYVESAYKKGTLNAYLQAKKEDLAAQTDFAQMSQQQFLRDAFLQPETTSKVQLLATRAWENMKGVTDSMGTKLNQILAQGMIDGSGAEDIADNMTDAIDGLTDARALTIARTEIIHAHAEGQLDAYEDLGVTELGVDVEWSTANDERVCPDCEDMEGQTFSVDEARGLIPLHPNCRCSWISATSTK